MPDDFYLGDKVITEDTFLNDDETIRLHLEGNDIQLQRWDGSQWVTEQTWGS